MTHVNFDDFVPPPQRRAPISSAVEWDDPKHRRFERTLPPGPPLVVEPPINWGEVIAWCAAGVAGAGALILWVLP